MVFTPSDYYSGLMGVVTIIVDASAELTQRLHQDCSQENCRREYAEAAKSNLGFFAE